MSKLRWIIFTAVIVLVLGGLIVYSRISNPAIDVSTIDTHSVIAASSQNGNIADHVYNNTQSEVILIEYGDYQCPGCGSAHPNIKTLLDEYGDKISFVYRNFPLTSMHPNARAAAASAEAAGLQGKYWEMHDMLFENQSDWENLSTSQRTEQFKSYASSLGIDATQFEADLASSAVSRKISFDQAVAAKDDVSATPTFLLNGEKLPNEAASGITSGDLTAIRQLLDAALNE